MGRFYQNMDIIDPRTLFVSEVIIVIIKINLFTKNFYEPIDQ